MKLFVVLIFSLGLLSCSKTAVSSKTAIDISDNELTGTWLLKEYSGGISYRVIIPTDAVTISFDESGKYSSSTNNAVTAKGNFSITAAAGDFYYSNTVINLFADDNNQTIYGINLRNDSLFLSEGCCDRFSYTYVRQ